MRERTRELRFAVCVLMLMSAGCAQVLPPSPEKSYARAIGPALTALEKWETSGAWGEFERVMGSECFESDDGKSYSYAFMVDWCLSEPQWCSQEDIDAVSEVIVPVAEDVGPLALELKSAFSVESVPQAVSAQHSQIVSCLDYRIELTSALIEVLNSSFTRAFPDLGQDPCTVLPGAKQSVAAYVSEHYP